MLKTTDHIEAVRIAVPEILKSEKEGSSIQSDTSSNTDATSNYTNQLKDKLTLSEEFLHKSNSDIASDKIAETKESSKDSSKNNNKLIDKKTDPEEQKIIDDLVKRDKEVRTHEEAHKAAGGGLVKGGASYNYTVGPDGKQYAVGGEVKIDMSAIDGDPKATITKMQQVRKAALAPADPSSQDKAVANAASSIESEAKKMLTKPVENSNDSKSKAIRAYQEIGNGSSKNDKFDPITISASLKQNQSKHITIKI